MNDPQTSASSSTLGLTTSKTYQRNLGSKRVLRILLHNESIFCGYHVHDLPLAPPPKKTGHGSNHNTVLHTATQHSCLVSWFHFVSLGGTANLVGPTPQPMTTKLTMSLRPKTHGNLPPLVARKTIAVHSSMLSNKSSSRSKDAAPFFGALSGLLSSSMMALRLPPNDVVNARLLDEAAPEHDAANARLLDEAAPEMDDAPAGTRDCSANKGAT